MRDYFITTAFVQQRTFFLFLFLVLFRLTFFLVRSTVLAKNYQIVIRKICWASGVPVDAQKLQNSNEKRLECHKKERKFSLFFSFEFREVINSCLASYNEEFDFEGSNPAEILIRFCW
jgi:hypothetical protein